MNKINLLISMSVVLGNSIPLMEINSSSVTSANITNTNVSYDLSMFTNGGKYDYAFDWKTPNQVNFDVDGNPINSNYDDFRFLVIKPVEGDCYLYFYWASPYVSPTISSTATFGISTSQVSDGSGGFVEDIKSYQADFVNSYGTSGMWLKYRISGLYDFAVSTSERIYVSSVSFGYSWHQYNNVVVGYNVGNSIMFQVNTDGDFLYDYWRKDHVNITSGKVFSYLQAKDLVSYSGNTSVGSSYYEYFYYFFDTDEAHPIQDLQSVTYDYQLFTYDVKYSFDTYRMFAGVGDAHDRNFFCYPGIYDADSSSVSHPFASVANQSLEFSPVSLVSYSDSKAVSGTNVVTVDRPVFNWFPYGWNHQITYSYDSIQNLSDSSVASLSVGSYKDFISASDKVGSDGSRFQWAFQIDPRYGSYSENGLYRFYKDNSHYNYSFINGAWWQNLSTHEWIDSECHEVKQSLITHLTYYTDSLFYSLDVLDTPKDTVSVVVHNEPYKDLGDMTFDFFKDIWDMLYSLVSNIRLVFAVLFSVVIGVLVLFVLSHVMPFFNSIRIGRLGRKSKKSDRSSSKK